MTEPPTIVGLSGSLRDESRTRVALRSALDSASDAGASTTLIDLRSYDLPVIDADARDAGDAPALKCAVAEADAVFLATPVYHGSYATPLKNALDYCGRDEFGGTTVGLIAVAGGGFPRPALAHLREVSRALDAWVYPDQVSIPNGGEHVADGEIVSEDIASRLAELGEGLVGYAGVADYPELLSKSDHQAPVAVD
ncbi:MAG: NAD(P)H-dependent oxidoreductase [Halolamina sp.]|uniref:NADPH-dependent FMN reductase n=1 Tax=Halolamina sp. TaxID=1940283 RepID=UPI002FC391BC